MSISLNDLYNRVQAIKPGLYVTQKTLVEKQGGLKFSDGLIMNFGVGYKFTFTYPFSNTNYWIVVGPGSAIDQSLADFNITNKTVNGFQIQFHDSRHRSRYMAIGYLITNRVLGWVM